MSDPGFKTPNLFPHPVIVLIQPQLAENIGTAARAMANCGLYDMRVVRPRVSLADERGIAAASGAEGILKAAKIFDKTENAIAGLHRVYATTARHRDMIKPVLTPRAAAAEMRAGIARGERIGILFGPERAGLVNDDLALADHLIRVPLNPEYSSLNLAQAVLVLGYEWFQSGDRTPGTLMVTNATRPADKAALLNFFRHLEEKLDDCGFLRNAEKRPAMVRNIRNFFQRAAPTEQELQTLHGIVKELSTLREKRKKAQDLE